MITVNFVCFYSMESNNLLQCHLKQDLKVTCSHSRIASNGREGAATLSVDKKCLCHLSDWNNIRKVHFSPCFSEVWSQKL